jgi:RimJ/RimL family protein N-acetyltransferase
VTAIRTARLTLEPVTPKNAVQLWQIMQSTGLREFQDVPRFTRTEFEKRVAMRPKRFDGRALGRFEWLIVPKDGLAVGWISLRVGDQGRGVAELGYSVLTSHRRRGFAGEASEALVAAAFAQTDLIQIDACCVPANVGSKHLLHRLGFEEARLQRNGAIVRGRPVDILIFEMTRERWLLLRGAQVGSENSIVMPASAKPK